MHEMCNLTRTPGTNLWREYLKEKYGCVFEKKPAQSVNPVYDVVPSKPVTIAAIILGLSLCAIILNALLLHFIRKNRIFGKSYGTLLRMRSIVEILASFIAVGFFSTLVYLDYDIPIWANSTLTSFYTFMLSNAYFLHFLISFNRLFCIYFPGRYDEIFEIGWRIRIIKVLVLFLSALITSLPFYTPCSYFMFSRVIYDILPVGCERKESSKATNHVVVIIWAICAFSSLLMDITTLTRIVYQHVAKSRTSALFRSRSSWSKNVRFFLQTFIVNLIICAGVVAVQVLSDRFESHDTRFYFALFQVLLGFVFNGFVPLVANRELRRCRCCRSRINVESSK